MCTPLLPRRNTPFREPCRPTGKVPRAAGETRDKSFLPNALSPTGREARRRADYDRRMPTRADAESLLFEFTKSDALRKHGRAVEEAMRAYARWFGETDPGRIETWGIVGLLHDFDYEQNPTEDSHLHVGGRVLRERGFPEEIVEAICSHADYMKIPRDTPIKKSIYACDEAVGFIGACVKVRPTKKIADLPVESVVKKLKDKAFARSVDRSYVYGGAEAVGRPLEEHVAFLIDALRPISDEIGL